MWQSIPWQEVIVGVCGVLAVVFLLRRWLFPSKKPAGCGSCGGCDKTSTTSCNTSPDHSKQ